MVKEIPGGAAMRIVLLALAAWTGALIGAGDVEAQESDGFVVAVLPFASSDKGKAEDLQKEIIAGMNELGPYTLVEQKTINEAVQQEGLQPGAAVPDAQSLDIARSVDAKIVARGRLERRGDAWVAIPEFVDVATRNTQNLPEVQARGVDDLGERIVEAFNTRNQANRHVIFGRDYLRSENYQRAITNFQQALEFDPRMASAHYYAGQAYLAMDSLNQALASLQEAIEIDPAYISAYHTIGTTYLEQGDTAQAKSFFEQLVQQKPEDCQIQIAYGYVMTNQLQEVEKGLQAFEKAKQLCPESPAAYQYLAYALPDDRRAEKIENFQRYLQLSEGEATDPEALEYLFGLYFAEEQYAEAQTTIDQALQADPSDANLQLYAGIVRAKQGQHRDAIRYYDAALGINPDLERAYLYRALAHKEAGNTAAYARDLEKAGRGNSAEILAGSFLRDAHQQLQQGRAGAALESLNRAAQLGGDRCAIAYYRGDAFYRMGKAMEGEDKSVGENERARSLFQQAINSLQNACGQYSSYAQGLRGNATQYIERVDAIIKKKSRSSR